MKTPRLFPAPIESRFQERRRSELVWRLRRAFLLGGLLFAAFLAFDYVLDPTELWRNAAIRVVTVSAYAGLYLATLTDWAHKYARALYLLGVTLGSASVTTLTVGMENGTLLAVGSQLLMIVLIAALSTGLRVAIAGYVLLVTASNLLGVILGASTFFLLSVNAFVLAGCLVGTLMAAVNGRIARRMFRLELELEVMATHDSLTSARNRRSFLEVTRGELVRVQRHGRPLSLLALDIDKFKSINDTYGHPVGDAVIQSLADTCREVLRSTDELGRMGGEEFAILLPEASPSDARQAAERLRAALAERVVVAGEARVSFTVSIGAATWIQGESLERLFSRADEALYDAKRSGRDRVCMAQKPEAVLASVSSAQ